MHTTSRLDQRAPWLSSSQFATPMPFWRAGLLRILRYQTSKAMSVSGPLQRAATPQVLGSNPRERTFPQVRALGLKLKCIETAFSGLRSGLRTRKRAAQAMNFE